MKKQKFIDQDIHEEQFTADDREKALVEAELEKSKEKSRAAQAKTQRSSKSISFIQIIRSSALNLKKK